MQKQKNLIHFVIILLRVGNREAVLPGVLLIQRLILAAK